jgi:hypothetical protein
LAETPSEHALFRLNVRDFDLALGQDGCLDTSKAVQAILMATLICGVLDGLSAVGLSIAFGNGPIRMLQGIASGMLGPSALKGGAGTAALGLALHFVIAFGASVVYYLASRVLVVLIDRALLAGIGYGIVVHLFMQYVVIPLSAIGKRPFVLRTFVALVIVHVVVVAPSIALSIRRFSR